MDSADCPAWKRRRSVGVVRHDRTHVGHGPVPENDVGLPPHRIGIRADARVGHGFRMSDPHRSGPNDVERQNSRYVTKVMPWPMHTRSSVVPETSCCRHGPTTTGRWPTTTRPGRPTSTGPWTGSTRWPDASTGARAALKIVEADGTSHSVTYAEMSARSSQVASWLSSIGAAKGDRLLLMLGNQVELWETLLACIKLGVVVIPATTLLTSADLDDRITRGGVGHVVAASVDAGKFDDVPGDYTRIAVGEPVPGWTAYGESLSAANRVRATGGGRRRRHPAALLHLGHHRPAQARRAHAPVLPGGAPVHDVLDRSAAR